MKGRHPLVAFTRAYASKYPRPRPGSAERPAYHAPDPLVNNPQALVRALPDQDLTFIHRPPPTAPTPFSFISNPSSPLLRPYTPPPAGTPLPPPIRPSAEKAQPARVTPEVMAEIRRLRLSNPAKHSRGKLAKRFGCTETFVAQIAALPKVQRKQLIQARNEQHERVRERWSEKKTMVRDIRVRRREFW